LRIGDFSRNPQSLLGRHFSFIHYKEKEHSLGAYQQFVEAEAMQAIFAVRAFFDHIFPRDPDMSAIGAPQPRKRDPHHFSNYPAYT